MKVRSPYGAMTIGHEGLNLKTFVCNSVINIHHFSFELSVFECAAVLSCNLWNCPPNAEQDRVNKPLIMTICSTNYNLISLLTERGGNQCKNLKFTLVLVIYVALCIKGFHCPLGFCNFSGSKAQQLLTLWGPHSGHSSYIITMNLQSSVCVCVYIQGFSYRVKSEKVDCQIQW